jgi:hypothetical protein
VDALRAGSTVDSVSDKPDHKDEDQFSTFEDLARRLVNVPKDEIDKLRAAEEAAKVKPSRSARRK